MACGCSGASLDLCIKRLASRDAYWRETKKVKGQYKVNGYEWASDADDFETTCAAVSGVFTPAVTESETTRTCANDNGRCCNHYNKREDSHRTTLIILLKTPYAIGTIAALFLHLLLPEDRVLDEEKEGYPRAFSDGEIAYES